mgnify:CR=1 FL=1
MATDENESLRKALVDRSLVSTPEAGVRVAAVALIFVPEGDGLSLCMIRRSEHPDDPWSGHMAFPGGRMDPQDGDGLQTAIRETVEEVGLSLQPSQCVGRLSSVKVPKGVSSQQLVVEPFVFLLEEPVALVPNEEVAAVYFFSLQQLLAGEGRGLFEYSWKGMPVQLDCIDLKGCRIWGLSLRILDELLEKLAPE